MRQSTFDYASDRLVVASISLQEKIDRAIALLREQEPPEGYYLAFSGGKDSCSCKELCRIAGVKFDAWYSNTTIDPPELLRFIKRHHADVKWHQPKYGNLFNRVATRTGTPPTRTMRWCCDEFKECHGSGRVKVFGVRAAESPSRAQRWYEATESRDRGLAICPIVYWSDSDVWEFIRSNGVPYCELYDEGWKRLGCVGCMLNPESQKREFARWPKYAEKWKAAVIANWQNHQGKLRRDGQPYMHSRFTGGEEFWKWCKAPRHRGARVCGDGGIYGCGRHCDGPD